MLLFALSSLRFNASREFRSRIAGLTEIYSQYFKVIFETQILVTSLAPFILRIEYEYAKTLFEDGARDVNNIWVPVVTSTQSLQGIRKTVSVSYFLIQLEQVQ